LLSYVYCAGFFASLVASYVAKLKGRKICMIISGVCYLIGAGLTTGAVPRPSGLSMLILGRIMLGVGVGFANSVNPSASYLPWKCWKSPLFFFFGFFFRLFFLLYY